MIVKVQISQKSSDGKTRVLIYDQSRELEYEEEVGISVLKALNGAAKKFFNAEVVPHPINWYKGETVIELKEEAPLQNW